MATESAERRLGHLRTQGIVLASCSEPDCGNLILPCYRVCIWCAARGTEHTATVWSGRRYREPRPDEIEEYARNMSVLAVRGG